MHAVITFVRVDLDADDVADNERAPHERLPPTAAHLLPPMRKQSPRSARLVAAQRARKNALAPEALFGADADRDTAPLLAAPRAR